MASRIAQLFRSSRSVPCPQTLRRYCSGYSGSGDLPSEDNGCDHNHWLIQVKDPAGTREEIIQGYVKLVANVLGSEQKAKKSMYSVSTKYYYAVGAVMPEHVAQKFRQFPNVRNVIPDVYVNHHTKDYGGEPFIDGKAVPYDSKHHELYHSVQADIRASRIEEGRLEDSDGDGPSDDESDGPSDDESDGPSDDESDATDRDKDVDGSSDKL